MYKVSIQTYFEMEMVS